MTTTAFLLIIVVCFTCDEPKDDDCNQEMVSPRDQIAAKFKDVLEGTDAISSHDADDTTAVAIEWIRLRDSATNGRIGRKADYLLGFISGRLRATPPEWWCREFRRGQTSPDGRAGFV